MNTDFNQVKTDQTSERVVLIIPARNEALSLPAVLDAVPDGLERLVVDNGSTDDTASIARSRGAKVIFEGVPGYGNACLAGIAYLREHPPAIVAFADADGSDGVENILTLLGPLQAGTKDLSLAWRMPGSSQALSLQQRFGNRLATLLIRLFWGHRYRDLGPMRAITWEALERINMKDRSYGWTVEMQIKALKMKLRILEYPLPYYERTAGESKISRTMSGIILAGVKIIWVIGRELVRK